MVRLPQIAPDRMSAGLVLIPFCDGMLPIGKGCGGGGTTKPSLGGGAARWQIRQPAKTKARVSNHEAGTAPSAP
jgi:hypothetical protein